MDSTNHRWFALLCLLGFPVAISLTVAFADSSSDKSRQIAEGKELFTRVWEPGDKRSFAGYGLGPVFNARSCAECHKQGADGGAGPRESNVLFVNAFVVSLVTRPERRYFVGVPAAEAAEAQNPFKQPDREKLAAIHPLLQNQSFFPLPRFGAGGAFAAWKNRLFVMFYDSEEAGFVFGAEKSDDEKASAIRDKILDHGWAGIRTIRRVGGVNIAFIMSQRNAPALFGTGLIDKIPAQILEAEAAEQSGGVRTDVPASQQINGRVSRLSDGRIGRFGWKANVPTLREFTLQAIANELGLEAPGLHRAISPWNKDDKAKGIDLTDKQVDALTEFVASVPGPKQKGSANAGEEKEIAVGRKLFADIGCASCHKPKLGDVDGIYSDLLLHDMGQALSDAGSYLTDSRLIKTKDNPNPLPVTNGGGGEKEPHPKFVAGPLEWRTPPLWGLRYSGPYLHDGRANTLEAAMGYHGGESQHSRKAFLELKEEERESIKTFLFSLPVPSGGPVKNLVSGT